MWAKFLLDIYLQYFVNFRPSRLQLGAWYRYRSVEGGGGGRGIPNKDRYGCADQGIKFFRGQFLYGD